MNRRNSVALPRCRTTRSSISTRGIQRRPVISLANCLQGAGWLGFMNSTIIDRESTTAVLGVDFDEAFVESNLAPGVVLLRLDSGSDNRIDSDHRHKKQDATGFERFPSCPEERTCLIDCMPQSQSTAAIPAKLENFMHALGVSDSGGTLAWQNIGPRVLDYDKPRSIRQSNDRVQR